MVVLLNREGLEAALVQRACACRPMRRVPTLRVRHRQPPHELRQVAIATGPEDKMPVIGHHAPRQNPHRQTGFRLPDHLLERLKVALLSENAPPTDGSIQHVVRISSARNP